MPDREGPIPPWMQVRDILRNKILSGELAPGAMVPSIVTIHQEYGIAKTTARKVLADRALDAVISRAYQLGRSERLP